MSTNKDEDVSTQKIKNRSNITVDIKNLFYPNIDLSKPLTLHDLKNPLLGFGENLNELKTITIEPIPEHNNGIFGNFFIDNDGSIKNNLNLSGYNSDIHIPSTVFEGAGLRFGTGSISSIDGKTWGELQQEEQEEKIRAIEDKYKERDEKRQKDIKKLEEQIKKIEEGQGKDKKEQQLIFSDLKISDLETSKGIKKGNMSFDKNGTVYVGNKKAGELRPNTAGYYLFIVLFEIYPLTIDYDSLAKMILKKLGKRTHSKTNKNYCQTIKSDIKKNSSKISELIQCYTTSESKKGYRLKPSKSQKKSRE